MCRPRTLIAFVLLSLFAAAIAAVAQNGTQQSSPQRDSPPAASADEQSVRENIAAYVRAFNAGDAKTLASLFLPDGEIVDQDGTVVQGREAIDQLFAAAFKQNPKRHIEVEIKSVRFVTPNVAIEDGDSKIAGPDPENVEHRAYTVIHLRLNGKWQIASARDLAITPPNAAEQLKQLEWLIGDWVDESPDALVRTTIRWSDDRRFILSDFTVKIDGDPVMSGTLRIGWDPLFQKFRCWVFDSEGGFGEGIWRHEGSQWIVQMTGVTSDGKAASATTCRTPLTKDRMTWQCRDRVIGGEKQPDGELVTIVRKPPEAR